MLDEEGLELLVNSGTYLVPTLIAGYHGKQAEEFELMVNNGMTPVDALLSATKVASELLRLNDKIGSIESGKFADIIAVNQNPLEDISTLKDVVFVMKDGEVFKN